MRIVKECKKGDRVVRGRDWEWGDQDRDSIYGIVVKQHRSDGWLCVIWVDKNNKQLREESYRIGNDGKYDLYYYEEDITQIIEQIISIIDKLIDKYETC